MLPQDPQDDRRDPRNNDLGDRDLKYDRRERIAYDDDPVYAEPRRPGIGAVIAALVLAAAIIYCVWYFVASDETDDVDLPDVDVTVDVDGVAPGT
jgi:hypothetical protein